MKITNLLLSVFIVAIFTSCSTSQNVNNTQMETKVLVKTTKGDITIKLYNETEEHKTNFIKLVEENYFDGLLFHRVIEGFMAQAGDPDSKNATANARLGSGGPGYTVAAEICPKFYHKKGSLSAARTGDQGNPTRRSSGSQFYMVTGKVMSNQELDQLEKQMSTKFTDEQRADYTTIGGTPFLDGQYSVFGEIVEGMEVLEAIEKVEKGSNDRPKEDVKIISMEIVK